MSVINGGNELKCDGPECNVTIKNLAWGKIKAGGWLFCKNGTQFCPVHKPEWYAKWREGKHE